jgi:hypothetical protein
MGEYTLKWILKKSDRGLLRINLTQNADKWRPVLGKVLNLQFQKNPRFSFPGEELSASAVDVRSTYSWNNRLS